MVRTLVKTTLVLGGARSGKSRYAERLAEESGLAPFYLATAEAGDEEMAARIARHRARRGEVWRSQEEPLELPQRLRELAEPHRVVLVDCLTLWISNLLGYGRDPEGAGRELVAALPQLAGAVILVSNEVGLGIVPENALARRFRDAVGFLHQEVAGVAERVVFVAAGLPLLLKPKNEGESP